MLPLISVLKHYIIIIYNEIDVYNYEVGADIHSQATYISSYYKELALDKSTILLQNECLDHLITIYKYEYFRKRLVTHF